MSEQRKSDLVELGGLWKSEKTQGVLTGTLGRARLVVLPNTYKQPGEKSPDFRVFVAPKDDEQRQPTRRQNDSPDDSDFNDSPF